MKKTNFTKKEKTKHFTLLNSFWISTQMHQLVCKQCTEFYFWVAHSTNQLEPNYTFANTINSKILKFENYVLYKMFIICRYKKRIKGLFCIFNEFILFTL